MKSVLVTGGTVRLGKAIVERLRADGWRVVTSSHRADAGADIVADLAEPMGAAKLYAAVLQMLGGQPPDALVNNAALFVGDEAEVKAVNLEAPKKLTMMMAGRESGVGAVVNILDSVVLGSDRVGIESNSVRLGSPRVCVGSDSVRLGSPRVSVGSDSVAVESLGSIGSLGSVGSLESRRSLESEGAVESKGLENFADSLDSNRPYSDSNQPSPDSNQLNPDSNRPCPDLNRPYLDPKRPYLDPNRPYLDPKRPYLDPNRPYLDPKRPYLDSKRKLFAYTRASAATFAATLRVNGVAPGPVLAPTEVHEKAGETLLDRRPTPGDVAAAVTYLLGAEAVTGTVIPVDAGQHLVGE